MRLAVDDAWPRPKTVWVHSKGQVPYLFRPCLDPCSPHEWPYNLEALRGTEDYEDILDWYCGRHPDVVQGDLDLFVAKLIRCFGERQISVQIYHDIDTEARHPWFTAWGFQRNEAEEDDSRMAAFQQVRDSIPALRRLFCRVGVSMRWGGFENRHVSDWGRISL